VAHEALFHSWGRLRTWISEDRELLSWRRRLDARVDEWTRAQDRITKAALLPRGAELAEASARIARRPKVVSPAARELMAAATRVERRRRSSVVVGVAAVMAALLALSGVAYRQAAIARAQRDAANQRSAEATRTAILV